MLGRGEREPEWDRSRYADLDVVALVSKVGDAAMAEFVDGLRPHLIAIQRGERHASDKLVRYLHEAAVSAAVILQAGGAEALAASERPVDHEAALSIGQAISELEQLAS